MTIPHKIISVNGKKAKVACGQKTHTLDIRLIPKVKAGDYVMNENNFAIYKVSEKEAQETFKLLNKINN